LGCALTLGWFVVSVFANAEEKEEGDDTEVCLCLLNGVEVCLSACAEEFEDHHRDCECWAWRGVLATVGFEEMGNAVGPWAAFLMSQDWRLSIQFSSLADD
jgi:hypothetical protein